MVCAILKGALLVQFLCFIAEVAGQSPCPNYFRYVRDNQNNEIMGHIEIPSPPRGIALHLSVGMSVAVALPTKYVGRLELAQSREESVLAVQQGRSLQYHIRFPLKRPIPTLTGLWFNNVQICSGPRAMGPIVTSIVLNHTLYPPGVVPLSEGQGNVIPMDPKIDDQPGPPLQPPQFVPRPTPSTTPKPAPKPPTNIIPVEKPQPSFGTDNVFINTNNINDKDGCGRRSNTNIINLLIAKGTKTAPGDWPWLAAIFVVKIEFEFKCAGTLLTNNHIITAAHCFLVNGENVPPEVLLIALGRYHLRDWSQSDSVNEEVAGYRLHPDYNPSSSNANADLAIVTLRNRVEFTTTIKPLCLWSGRPNLADIVGQYGYVVGWGRDEFGNPYRLEPRMVRVPIVSQEDCLRSHHHFVLITSNKTLCAGARDGSGPCNGDSGTGLVLQDSRTGRYHLRGIVSRSLGDSNSRSTCDLTQLVVYIDVAKYLDWIQEQLGT